MKKLMPFVGASLAMHVCGFAAVGTFFVAVPRIAGDPFGDPDRVFVSVISDKDLHAVAPLPAPVDSLAATNAKKAKEEAKPEASPEVLTRSVQDSPAECREAVAEEVPNPDPRILQPEKKVEREQEESCASDPQVASTLQMRRAALGSELRDFQSLLLAAIRQATFFPQDALKEKRFGQVKVTFTMDKDRTLTMVEVVVTSGCQALDNAALEIVRRASEKFPPLPPALDRESLTYTVPINFIERRSSGTAQLEPAP
jgi:protein TonB